MVWDNHPTESLGSYDKTPMNAESEFHFLTSYDCKYSSRRDGFQLGDYINWNSSKNEKKWPFIFSVSF